MKFPINKEKFRQVQAESNTLKEKKYKILLVDDEQANLKALSMLLEDEYNIITVHSGPEALFLIRNDPDPEQISLIISDQRMPEMTGVEFFKQTLTMIPESIRILLTGYTDVPDIIDAINEGQIYKYLTKPIEPTDLIITVKRALESYELAKQKQLLIEELRHTNENLEALVQQRTEEIQNKMVLLNKEMEVRKQTESALRESEKIFKHFTENSLEVLLLWDLKNDIPIFISPSITRMTGFTAQEVLHSRRDLMITPKSKAYYLPIQTERTRSFLTNPDIELEYIDELEYYRKDGSTYQAEIYKHYMLDKHDNPIMVGVLRDITERKIAEESLRDSESFNRGLVENLPDYIMVYGSDFHILYVNPAITLALGYSSEEMVHKSILSFIAEESRDAFAAILSDPQKGTNISVHETVLVTVDDNRRYVIVKGTSIKYHNTRAVLLLLIDFTERKLIEQALKENEEKFISIFEETPDPILILDSTYHILDVNHGFEEKFEYAHQDVIGIFLDDLRINLNTDLIHRLLEETTDNDHIPHSRSIWLSGLEFHSS